MSPKGYFIDWNGQVRSTDDPGHGYCCEVDKIARSVTVISKRGSTVHETQLYRSLDAIARAGILTEYVSGSYPFLHRAINRPDALLDHGTRPRARQWLHELRDRCTTGARHVYARFLPGHAVKTVPHDAPDSNNLPPRLSDPNYFLD
ncbi:MAG: hypothetical protein RL701_285 [Pseudomonadota bacterium]|jgi:hypothetical protein